MANSNNKPAAAAAADPFKDFQKLNDQVYVRPGKQPHGNDPSAILLFAWGDSRPKHIAKFVDGYLKLFPTSKIVVILGPILQALSEKLEKRSRRMIPVVEAIYGAQREASDSEPNILAHVMSNTGGVNFAATLHAYNCMSPPFEARQLPATFVVYDSTPGSSHFFRNVAPWSRAMAIGTAHIFPWPAIFTQAIAATFLAAIHAVSWITGTPTAAEFSVGAANDPELSPKSTPRLYLYSKSDDIIAAADIEEHAADAVEKGYGVAMELFEGTGHVGHMRAFPEKYWGAISKGWEAAQNSA